MEVGTNLIPDEDDATTAEFEPLASSFEGKPAYEEIVDTLSDEYGYGFWFRFMTAYPTRLWNGKSAPWYFVSRLAGNLDYKDNKVGDRLLAIF